MKSMKKMLALLMALVLTFALVGCGGSSDDAAAPADNGATEEKTEEAPADDASADDATADDTAEAGDSEGGLIKVGYAQIGAESDWRLANTESFKQQFTEENGYELIFNDGQQKQENQIKAIRDFIAQDVDYIVLAPVVETGWDTVLQEAKDAGIPVILSDRGVDVADDSLYTTQVCGDFVLEGNNAGDWLAQELKDKGRDKEEINVCVIEGTTGASAATGRKEGFAAKADENGWKILDSQDGDFTQEGGQEVMESFLKNYDDIDVVVCANDNEAFGAIAAIEAAGKTTGPEGDIWIISFDAVKQGFQYMVDGKLNCDVECNPLYGPKIDEIIKKLENGEELEKLSHPEEGVFDYKTAADLIDSRPY